MSATDIATLRQGLSGGSLTPVVVDLAREHLAEIAWSGSDVHLENVARQLDRVASGEVEYLVVTVAGVSVSKGGVDFAVEPGSATIWQLATHPELEGLGLATMLVGALEDRARRRGVHRFRLAVEVGNHRARRLYEHLGYTAIGTSTASWEAEAADGSRFLYVADLVEMAKDG